jgi:protoheme IX farnesyltransferase
MTETTPDILDSADDATHLAARAATAPRSRLVDFYELTKPRMNFLVVITTAVGYYMAVRHSFEWARLLHTIFGTALTAAGASVLNQFIERKHDALMPRTADRPLPAGRINPGDALLYGVLLGVTGVAYLTFAVNGLTALLGAFTLLSYVFVYTPMKRYTPFNTVVGAVPGAIPPMMGVTAVHGAISPEALALFGILFLWQMPHFLAIAILYRDDYARGGFKMLPVVDRDLSVTGRQIVLYSIALIPASIVPVTLNMAGITYFVTAMLLGLAFLSFGISCAATGTRSDARKLFFSSILYLPLLFAGLMIDKL